MLLACRTITDRRVNRWRHAELTVYHYIYNYMYQYVANQTNLSRHIKLTKKDLQVTYCIFQRFPSSCWKMKFEDNLLKAYVYLSWYVRQTLSVQRNTWQTLLGNHMTVCVPYNIILHKDLISGQEINFWNPLAQWASRFQFSLPLKYYFPIWWPIWQLEEGCKQSMLGF